MKLLTRCAAALAAGFALFLVAAPSATSQCTPDVGPGAPDRPFLEGYDELDLPNGAKMYGAYSMRERLSPPLTSPNNNCVMWLIPYDLASNKVIFFSSGYGGHAVNVYNTDRDADLLDEVARECFGLTGTILVTFICAHQHDDHVRQDVLVNMEERDWQIEEIVVQSRAKGGAPNIGDEIDNWPTLHTVINSPSCKTAWSASTDAGVVRVYERSNSHVNGRGTLDVFIQVDADDAILLWGAVSSNRCSRPPGTWEITLHGNINNPPAGWGTP